jgi:hypothetical protein
MKRLIDPIALLEEKHRETAALLGAVTAATDPADRARLFACAADLLAMHSALEERHFYPVIEVHRGRVRAEAAAEHAELRRRTAELVRERAVEPLFTERIRRLSALLDHHVRQERGALFPMVRALFTVEQLDVLGQQMMATLAELEGSDPRFELCDELPSLSPL